MSAVSLPRNKLLASLPSTEHEAAAAALRTLTTVRVSQTLYREGSTIRDVYFPSGGVFSIEKTMPDGRVAEVALVGSEGMLGGEVFYGVEQSSVDCRVICADGPVYAMKAEVFRAWLDRRGALYNLVVRHQQALLSQIVQTTACNALHSSRQRTCRWLLMVHDRTQRDLLPIKPQLLWEMLGMRPQASARSNRKLAAEYAIATQRDGITILDRGRLRTGACECYANMTSTFQRLLPEIGFGPADVRARAPYAPATVALKTS